MPEYHNIQTFQRLAHGEFSAQLERAQAAFNALGLLPPRVQALLQEFRWDPADGGYAYSNEQIWIPVQDEAGALEVAPFVIGWADPADLEAPHWLEAGLLIRSDDICCDGSELGRIRAVRKPLLYRLVQAFLPLSLDYPVVLTNEAQDTSALGVLTGEPASPLDFELAAVGHDAQWPFPEIPAGYEPVHTPAAQLLFRSDAWEGERRVR